MMKKWLTLTIKFVYCAFDRCTFKQPNYQTVFIIWMSYKNVELYMQVINNIYNIHKDIQYMY